MIYREKILSVGDIVTSCVWIDWVGIVTEINDGVASIKSTNLDDLRNAVVYQEVYLDCANKIYEVLDGGNYIADLYLMGDNYERSK